MTFLQTEKEICKREEFKHFAYASQNGLWKHVLHITSRRNDYSDLALYNFSTLQLGVTQ